mgnify:CR=1 FL=1
MTSVATAKRRRLVNLRNFPLFRLVSWSVLFFLYVPLLHVMIYSFNSSRIATIWESFSTKWYVKTLHNTDIQRALKNSLQVGLSATVLSTTFAVLGALGLVRMRKVGTAISWALIGAPLIIAEIVLAVGTLAFFILAGIPLGKPGLIIAHTAFCICCLLPLFRALCWLLPFLSTTSSRRSSSPARVLRHCRSTFSA